MLARDNFLAQSPSIVIPAKAGNQARKSQKRDKGVR